MQNQSYHRLRQAKEALDISFERFGEPLGVSGQAVHNWVNGVTPIRLRMAQSIEKAHGISSLWLLEGKGSMFINNIDDLKQHQTISNSVKGRVSIPLISLPLSAGHGFDVGGEPTVVTSLTFDREWLHRRIGIAPHHLFLAEIEGDSMVPTLNPHDLIMVDKSAPSVGFQEGIWVFSLDNALHVKRIQHLGQNTFQAISDNQNYKPFSLEEPFHFIGRMVKLVLIDRAF